jgi:hypothetical protein
MSSDVMSIDTKTLQEALQSFEDAAKRLLELRLKALEGRYKWHMCRDGDPKDSGRYGVLYQYKEGPLRIFTGDYDACTARWISVPPDNRILAWCEYPEFNEKEILKESKS